MDNQETERTRGRPFSRMVGSTKVILTMFAMALVTAIVLISKRPWQELAVVVVPLSGMIMTLVNGISREDAAEKTSPQFFVGDQVAANKIVTNPPPRPAPAPPPAPVHRDTIHTPPPRSMGPL